MSANELGIIPHSEVSQLIVSSIMKAGAKAKEAALARGLSQGEAELAEFMTFAGCLNAISADETGIGVKL